MEPQQGVIVLAILVVSTFSVSQAIAEDDFSVYENSEIGVSLEYQSDWQYEEVSDPTFGVTFYAPYEDESDQYSENFSVAAEQLGIKLTPKEYADISVENMKGLIPNFNLVSSEPTTFAGKPAQKIIFEIPDFYGLEIKSMTILTVDDTVGYSLSFFAEKSSFDSYLSLVNKTIESFEISGLSEEPVEIEQFPLSEYLIYADPDNGFTIKYPPNWKKTETTSSQIDVIFQSPLESVSDIFAENSVVSINKIPGMSLADYTQVSLNNLESRPGLVGTPQNSPTTIAGLPAHQIKYTEKSELGIESKAWMAWTVANDSVYLIGFGSTPDDFDVYEPIFQNILDSAVIEELDLPNPVSGTYSNPEAGFEMQLPDGWEGIEQQKDGMTMVVVSPGITMQPFSQGSQMSDKVDFSIITIVMGKFSSIKEELSSAISEDMKCTYQTAQVIELNSMKTQESESDCEDPVMGTIKGLEYTFATKDTSIVVSYGAISKNPAKTFDENLDQFKESLKTLKIQNTLDISDPFATTDTLEMTASKESVTVDGKNVDVLFASNSDISNVSFDEQANSLTFDQKGNADFPMTEVYLGDVMDEPYLVSVGNKPIDDFVVVHDTTNGQTSIFFESESPTGSVTITNQAKTTEIPDWIRGNAQWWAQGAIGDSDFVSGIQYLIKEGIMTIPETAKGQASEGAKEIPSWIKNNADWWAQGLISDDDFVKGIQFLIENGIMEV